MLTDSAGLVPPQSIELEEAVLGALMLEKDAVIEVQGVITPEAFYKEAHQIIYKAILDLSMELKPIDLYTVTEKLKQNRKLSAVGGAAYLAQLTQKVGSAAHIEYHSKIIAQKYVQRELIRAATEIQKKAYDESMDVTDLIDLAEGEIFKVSEGHVKRDVQKSKGYSDQNVAGDRGGFETGRRFQWSAVWIYPLGSVDVGVAALGFDYYRGASLYG